MAIGLPWFFVPAIVLGALVLFVGLWVGILWLLARVGGYRSLLAFRSADARSGARLPRPRVVYFGGARYKGRPIELTTSREGLGIHMMSLLIFHPDLRVPWDRVEVGAVDARGVDVVLDGRVHLYVPQATADAIAQARPR